MCQYLNKIYRKKEGKCNTIQTSPFLNHEKNYLDMIAFFCPPLMRQKRTVQKVVAKYPFTG